MRNERLLIGLNWLIASIAYYIGRVQYAWGNKHNAISTLSHTASFCVSNFIGTFTWASLEETLLKIAHKELPLNNPVIPHDSSLRKKVLHVITTAYSIGGHTRYLINWVINDLQHDITIVLVNQDRPMPEVFQHLRTRRPDINIIVFAPNLNSLCKAAKLRELAVSHHYIFSHHHSHDVVPLLAFADKNIPPVAYINHADHAFWVGRSVTDLLIQFRTTFSEYDAQRRCIKNFITLPVPITLGKVMEKEKAREILKISMEKLVLLTIASDYKFKITEKHNYFKSVIELLNIYPDSCLYIIGISPSSSLAKQNVHERIFYCGIIENTDLYEYACDLFVDSFPFSSPTSVMQAMSKGRPAVLMYDAAPANIVFPQTWFLKYFNTHSEWRSKLAHLMTENDYRKKIAQQQLQYIKQTHDVTLGWQKSLSAVYHNLASLTHNLKVPVSKWINENENTRIHIITANHVRLSGIIITNNKILKYLIKFLSAGLFVCRQVIQLPSYQRKPFISRN